MTTEPLGIEKLTQLARELQAEPDEAVTTQSVLLHALEIVADAEMASLTVRARRHTFQTLGATSSTAEQVDQGQYELGEGPCVASAEGLDGAEWFRSSDVSKDQRWPRWGPTAFEHGVRSFLSVCLRSKGKPFGALNMYSSKRGAFADPAELEVALLYGVHAANALSSARLVSGLEAALGSRHEIGMAQGILIERYGLTVEQSFAFLRRLSQNLNRKLNDVAREIVTTRSIPNLTSAPPATPDEDAPTES
ncbi:ANTAR domain-containing protein [Epidermidibacterium keratini]|uniref:ANTAR domain-containing protein n=1 Tax=Epidermidibacterium keratini TaxID=1891644 RepID=A0A7L4YR37_9ACTN|nr:GAF and ANTAR domain-containing protein [Epidermidibacterium keratini]QHC01374.1 ANTAR domain-containing protein [Epidermidibacterium keratini]